MFVRRVKTHDTPNLKLLSLQPLTERALFTLFSCQYLQTIFPFSQAPIPFLKIIVVRGSVLLLSHVSYIPPKNKPNEKKHAQRETNAPTLLVAHDKFPPNIRFEKESIAL